MPETQSADFNDVAAQWNRLQNLIPAEDLSAITQVYALAERVHHGQKRKTAEGAADIPYIVHPLRVANILAGEWKRTDFAMIATALLHDVIEDVPAEMKQTLPREISLLCGTEILDAVYLLTKPELPQPCPPDAKAQRDARYFSVIRNAPEWMRLIKCADRADNLRDALAWGNEQFWAKYSSETLGWHLWIARETAAIAEVAIFKVLVEGERTIRGRVPVWADGNMIDPAAAILLPEHAARTMNAVCIAERGDTLIMGIVPPVTPEILQSLRSVTGKRLHVIEISPEAIEDAHAAMLFGTAELRKPLCPNPLPKLMI